MRELGRGGDSAGGHHEMGFAQRLLQDGIHGERRGGKGGPLRGAGGSCLRKSSAMLFSTKYFIRRNLSSYLISFHFRAFQKEIIYQSIFKS